MGSVNSSTARSWRVEFKRNGIGENELIKIRDSLVSLKNPEFIPNSLTLIGLLKANECKTSLGSEGYTLKVGSDLKALRKRTAKSQNEFMAEVNKIL